MPLPIRDGNQSLTTLSTLIVNSAHVPAHTVVSLGSQAITDIAQAVSGVELGPNSISALEHISVTISAGTSITIGNVVSVTGGLTNAELRASSVTIGGSVQVSNFPATQSVSFGNISGSVTASISGTPSVTFSSIQVSNFPATQSVTFTTAPVTFGQASVTFSSITGSVSVLNFPATQTTTFSAITGSVSILNLPATQTVTFTQASVTFGTPVVTGSVSVLNFPSTQTIAGTVTVSNAILAQSLDQVSAQSQQTIGFSFSDGTGATFDSGVIPDFFLVDFSGSEFGSSAFSVGIQTSLSSSFSPIGSQLIEKFSPVNTANLSLGGWISADYVFPVQTGLTGTVLLQGITSNAHLSACNFMIVPAAGCRYARLVYGGASGGGNLIYRIRALSYSYNKATVGNSVTIGSLPAISGTVTVNTAYEKYANIYTSPPSNAVQLGFGDSGNFFVNVRHNNGLPVRQQEGSSVTIGSLPAISGTVTANVNNVVTINSDGASFSQRVVSKSDLQFTAIAGAIDPTRFSSNYTVLPIKITSETDGLNLAVDLRKTFQGNDLSAISNDSTAAFVRTQVVGGSVTIGSLPAISGTVTVGAMPSGALTTRFGTVVTANLAAITSAVTNTSRKYLLAQNISAETVTIGIGFSPTTTQGIQLTAGGGLTFDAFCPTGAVYWLGAVTGAAFTILEG